MTMKNKNSVKRLSVEIAARYGNCQIFPLKLLHFEAAINANFFILTIADGRVTMLPAFTMTCKHLM